MAKASVFVSSVLDASIDDVWAKIRDFNALPAWHPAVANSHIEGDQPSDKVGCIRNFNLKDGGNIREQLLTLSDATFTCTYSILESPMAVENYVATLRLTPVTDGNRTYNPMDRGICLSTRRGRGTRRFHRQWGLSRRI